MKTTLTVETVRTMLETNTTWLEAAVVAIYKHQTNLEKGAKQTVEHNGVGFTGFDARQGSYMAEWILKGNHLSGKFLPKARKMMKKYAGQLVRIAEAKAAAKAASSSESMHDRIAEKAEYARREQELEDAAYTREMQNEMAMGTV